mmetsp:Transcript_135674/g.306978  ORF Transcript_135674/g.306978 Transcript_135674/m.306978 type:complete len:220 (-) Transcript_135674:237-896(-)
MHQRRERHVGRRSGRGEREAVGVSHCGAGDSGRGVGLRLCLLVRSILHWRTRRQGRIHSHGLRRARGQKIHSNGGTGGRQRHRRTQRRRGPARATILLERRGLHSRRCVAARRLFQWRRVRRKRPPRWRDGRCYRGLNGGRGRRDRGALRCARRRGRSGKRGGGKRCTCRPKCAARRCATSDHAISKRFQLGRLHGQKLVRLASPLQQCLPNPIVPRPS